MAASFARVLIQIIIPSRSLPLSVRKSVVPRASFSSFPSVVLLLTPTLLFAEPSARLELSKQEAWTGEKLSFFVELKAEGSFKGAPSFDLPEIPQTVIIKVGSPVLSSDTEGDTEFFIQRHEFALFSQQSGELELPPIRARFGHQKGYTGPVFDASVATAASRFRIKRPPNSADIGFLVTTESLQIEESWDPTPGPLATGAVLKRTIVQKVSQQSGISLKPAPTPEIEGVRTYTSSPEVRDQTERGRFTGERTETITYLIQSAGLHTLPEIRYDWWNPETETLESKTLPAVSFAATAPPPPPPPPSPKRFLPWLLGALVLLAVALFRKAMARGGRALALVINPPRKKAERAFLKACRSHDPEAAIRSWEALRPYHPTAPEGLSPAFAGELSRLYSRRYGEPSTEAPWDGEALRAAFVEATRTHRSLRPPAAELPELNP